MKLKLFFCTTVKFIFPFIHFLCLTAKPSSNQICYVSPISCSLSKTLNKAKRKPGHLNTLYISMGLKNQSSIQWTDILLWPKGKSESGMQLFWLQVIFASLSFQVWLQKGGAPASELVEVAKIDKLCLHGVSCSVNIVSQKIMGVYFL